MKFIDLFFIGGIVMWPILLCSIAAVAIIVEKFITLHKPDIDANQLLTRVRASLSHNDVPGAMSACAEYKAPVAAIFRAGLLRYNDGHSAVRKTVEAASKTELFKLEKGLGLLGNIAGVAPMLGFLGTVTGMIRAFQVIQNAGGNVNPTMLAGGIWEAMLATAFGLSVGVPALGFYNHFVQRITKFVFEFETQSEEFIDLVQHHGAHVPEMRKGPGPGPAPAEPQRRLFTDDTEFFEPKKD
jgi:biopolymer transport protein ExbB